MSRITYSRGGTHIGSALRHTHQHIQSNSRRESGVPEIVVLLTDGVSYDQVDEAAAELQDDGVSVFAIGIAGYDEDQLMAIASSPKSTHAILLNDFTEIEDVVDYISASSCAGWLSVPIETLCPWVCWSVACYRT